MFGQPESKATHHKGEAGQGLVEYALILTLVAVVVVVILALLGPSIGKVFSTVVADLQAGGSVNNASPTATPTVTWTFCANENGVCNIPSGSHQVRYGANNIYNTLTFTGPMAVNCNNATFGDPVQNVAKTCDYQ